MILVGIVTLLIGLVARVAIARASRSTSRVDHYYWMLAAEAYRTQRGLPVRLSGKYLLEDEEQGYPPLFGLLLGRCRIDRFGAGAVLLLEALQAAVITALLVSFGAPPPAIVLAVATYIAAPLLVIYNTQLNSRVLGDLLLFSVFAAEAAAVAAVPGMASATVLWGAATIGTALVLMTHKMTMQLYAVLLLPWSWALGTAAPVLVFAGGVLAWVVAVGWPFARYQIRAHADIVRFWHRHWPNLGAHQFRDSAIYRETGRSCVTCFHQPGLRGVAKHLKTVASYAPANLVLPVASLVSGVWPPVWVLVWLAGIYVWALATLFVPRLKCLGGGHLYVFNAIAPGACYVGWLTESRSTVALLWLGAAMTAVALVMARRTILARTAVRDEAFERAIAALAARPRAHVAVFPLQSAEAVAALTHHAVLWGAHGYGFANMEGFFPVLTRPVSEFLRKYAIRWVLCDRRFWPLGADGLRREGLRIADETAFGDWVLTEIVVDAVAPA